VEISAGVHIIPAEVGGRPLQLPLLCGDERVVLIDTGSAPDPEQVVFPYLASIGKSPESIDVVIVTHPDFDHCGGTTAIKRASGRTLLTCGEADRVLIEDPAVIWAERYNRYSEPHQISYDEPSREHIMEMLGGFQPIDFTWVGGETLRIGRDWLLEIHHTPGHSKGHLTVYDRRNHIAFIGDAVQGSVYLDTGGRPALCPTYTHVDSYLSTVRYLRQLGAETLVGCHWPIKRNREIESFLDETEQFVALAERALLAVLSQRPQGSSLRELIDDIGPTLGDWPRSTDLELVYALSGHLDRLVATGMIGMDATKRPTQYRMASEIELPRTSSKWSRCR
jgi:glyoxylase-like metal-dependent hydrolase (beta-lactamase superfamily II)